MSEASSTSSRERIIPMQIESDDVVSCNSEEAPSSQEMEVKEVLSEEQLNSQLQPILKRTLPMFNVKEKIVFIIDSAEDEKFTPFHLKSAQHRSLAMLKQAVEIFLQNKILISKKHEYALAVLNENDMVWLVDFTSNIKDILNALQKIESSEPEDIFQLNSIFDVILKKVKIPEVCEVEGTIIPPPYVVRAVLLYARSYTMPEIQETEEIQHLLEAPFFTLDLVMTHEPVDDGNNCNKIFNVLQNLDRKGFAYFFSVERDARNLFKYMGKLLGHPLQRPMLESVIA